MSVSLARLGLLINPSLTTNISMTNHIIPYGMSDQLGTYGYDTLIVKFYVDESFSHLITDISSGTEFVVRLLNINGELPPGFYYTFIDINTTITGNIIDHISFDAYDIYDSLIKDGAQYLENFGKTAPAYTILTKKEGYFNIVFYLKDDCQYICNGTYTQSISARLDINVR